MPRTPSSAASGSSEPEGPAALRAAWARALARMREEVGAHEYENWLLRLELVGVDGGAARVAAPTRFISGWVERHYGESLLRRVARELPGVTRLAFHAAPTAGSTAAPDCAVVPSPEDPPAAVTPAPRPSPVSAPSPGAGEGDGLSPSQRLDPRFTFERFVVGKPNELAHAAARRVAEGEQVTFNPLFLYSASGLGKTHLMHAIGWRLAELRPEARVMLLTAEQFMYRFIQALRSKEMISFKQMFRSVDVLMIDDVQFIAGKDSTQDEFFHTFNALVDQGKQVVISGDRNPVEMDGLEERIKSRLQWGLVVDLHPTDYELRLGILQSKVEALAAAHPEVEVSPRVLEFLAHRISSNVRVLEGALTRLMAFASLVGRRADLEMAQECLADVLRASDRKVTVEEIQRKVATHFNLRINDMLSPRRARAVARPRQMAMYLSKTLTSKSLPDIGRRFGGRDHTTVIHAVRTIEKLKETDAQIAEDVELLRRMLEA